MRGGIVVTGASTGIGAAIANRLSAASYLVFGTVRRPDDDAALERIGAVAVLMDVTDGESIRAARNKIERQLDTEPLVGVVNNAGIAAAGPLEHLPLDELRRVLGVNVVGLVGVTQAFLPALRRSRGRAINIGSVSGRFPTSIPYGATKSAVIGLSVSLRIEAAGLGVKVSVACPGPVHSTEQQRFRLIGIERAAQLILRGVEPDQAIIVFPLSARLLWWMYRLSPRLLFPIGRKVVRDFRAEHGPPTAPGRPTKSPLTARGAER